MIESSGPPLAASSALAAEQRTRELQNLQSHRVRRILLVASLYDSYILSEGQHLTELLVGAYHNLALGDPPIIDRVAGRLEALDLLALHRYDLVIVMANTSGLTLSAFGAKAKAAAVGTPVVVMAYHTAELDESAIGPDVIDRAYLWQGDVRLLATIIKLAEDERNAAHDMRAGVRTLILIEDSIPFYSVYLPLLFSEVTHQTDRLMSEGLNTGQRLLRMRLRPRILHATTFEEGWALYEAFRDTLLCLVTDVRFPREGVLDDGAGTRLVKAVRASDPHLPVLLQSSNPAVADEAAALGAGFLHKQSPTLLLDFHTFMLERLGFGDFVFRLPDGTEVARASDVEQMLEALRNVPGESLLHHAVRNAFSNWLMARTEFDLASALRPMTVTDFETVEDLREFLCTTLTAVLEASRRGQVVDFAARRFRATTAFVRIGGGSLGGKGRGLAFMHDLMSREGLGADLEGVKFMVPRSAVIGTEVFDEFVAADGLGDRAARDESDMRILREFQEHDMPASTVADLRAYLAQVDFPLAVRSSSLLEDSRHLPAAGIFPTHMLPNRGTLDERLDQLIRAIRHIYAATFFSGAKRYLVGSPGRVADEKMAIVLQEVVGRLHDNYVYPDVSGVARSHNVYPVGDLQPDEGIVIAALGLGRTVVDGERAVRFSPQRPVRAPQFTTAEEIVRHSQREFWALDVSRVPDFAAPDGLGNQVKLGLDVARRHGTLAAVASVYSPDNDQVYDGLDRPGVPLVTLAPMRKHRLFPLGESVCELLALGRAGLADAVEIEFALNLTPTGGEMALLQIRPQALPGDEEMDLGPVQASTAVVGPCRALGSGVLDTITDLIVVRPETFDRGRTPEVAIDVALLNERLQSEGRPYVLIGPGRWGSADRWLGVPVAWSAISAARVIVESGLDGIDVPPSDGAHFFHNVVSLGIGYFTASRSRTGEAGLSDAVDWDWLAAQPAETESAWVRHIRLKAPLRIRIDGRRGEGVILKPDGRAAPGISA